MTPAQLAVEADALLSGGRTPEEVARMQHADRALDALCIMVSLYGRDLDIDEPRAFRIVDDALVVAGLNGVFGSAQWRGEQALSIPESVSGASAHRPSGGTP